MSSFQMNKIHSAEMIARQASRANSRVSQGIRQKSSFDSEASVASFESEANSRAGTTSTQANSHRVKADYVLCYFAKDIKSSTEPPEMPNKKDPSFVLNKQRLVFLENLANYGCEIEQVSRIQLECLSSILNRSVLFWSWRTVKKETLYFRAYKT